MQGSNGHNRILKGCKGDTHKGDREKLTENQERESTFKTFSGCFQGVFGNCQGFSGCSQGVCPYPLCKYPFWTFPSIKRPWLSLSATRTTTKITPIELAWVWKGSCACHLAAQGLYAQCWSKQCRTSSKKIFLHESQFLNIHAFVKSLAPAIFFLSFSSTR